MEQPNSENIGLQLRNALFGAPGEPVNQGAVGFGRRILPMLGITSFPQDAASDAEPKLLGTTTMTETRPDEATLSGRAVARTQYEATKQQQNLEDISFGAGPYIKEDAKADEVEEDWLANFFDRGRLVSDEEMQLLWSHILASEVNKPGSFSSRTVNLLSSLSKKEALLFKKLCCYNWLDKDPEHNDYYTSIIMDEMISDSNSTGIQLSELYNLQDIGLIKFNDVSAVNFAIGNYENTPLILDYQGRSIQIYSIGTDNEPQQEVSSLAVGKVKLSYSGRELARICNPEPDFDYMNQVISFIEEQGFRVKNL